MNKPESKNGPGRPPKLRANRHRLYLDLASDDFFLVHRLRGRMTASVFIMSLVDMYAAARKTKKES